MNYTQFTYNTGFVVENGQKRPLNEKEIERDRIYSASVVEQFIPKT